MSTPGRTAAPYEVLTSRQALLEAAKLNRRALTAVNGNGIPGDPALAVQYAQIAQSLATYALAVDRWSP
jgi:hypothetical protein